MAPPAPLVPPPMELMTITKRQELMAGGGGGGWVWSSSQKVWILVNLACGKF